MFSFGYLLSFILYFLGFILTYRIRSGDKFILENMDYIISITWPIGVILALTVEFIEYCMNILYSLKEKFIINKKKCE